MRHIIYSILTLWVGCLTPPATYAQNTPTPLRGKIAATVKSSGKGVRIRLAPDAYGTWMALNGTGWTIERTAFTQGGELLPPASRSSQIIQAGMQPASQADWQAALSDDYVAVAAQALYGKSFVTTRGQVSDYIELNTEQDNRYGYAMFSADHSLKAAELLGLYWEDATATEKEAYLYKIYPTEPPPFPIDTGFAYVVVGESAPVPKVHRVTAVSGDRNVMLTWEKPIASNVVSYHIERYEEDGDDFKQVNTKPIIAIPRRLEDTEQHYQDTLLENGKDYSYRIITQDAFGDTGEPSDPVLGRGTPPGMDESPYFDAAKEVESGKVMLQWVFPERYGDQLVGFALERSEHHKKGYKVIAEIPADQRTFLDEYATEKSYYRITAIAKDGRNRSSVETFVLLSDEEPPAPPRGLQGEIDRNGHLVLTWDGNAERDILGYRVFFANAEDVAFARLTPHYLRESAFSDTVNMDVLNECIYYRVVALDLRQNVSDFSEVLKVRKPDVIPPAAPRFLAFESTVEGVGLTWSASASEDVVSYSLRRRPLGESLWESIHEEKHDGQASFSYRDVSATEGETYEYSVWAVDDAGLPGISNPIRLKAQTDYFRQPVEQLRATTDRRGKYVELTWKYIESADLTGFMVYRSFKGSEPVEYRFVSASEVSDPEGKVRKKLHPFHFQDADLRMNTDYVYRIKAVFGTEGVESVLSERVDVNY